MLVLCSNVDSIALKDYSTLKYFFITLTVLFESIDVVKTVDYIWVPFILRILMYVDCSIRGQNSVLTTKSTLHPMS